MYRYDLIWHEDPLSLEEWSKLDLGAMLHRRPSAQLIDGYGKSIIPPTVVKMPRLILQDGVSLSVQAGEHNYSLPRDDKGPYTKVEVGFPSEKPPEAWKNYTEEWSTPTNTIYNYVPLAMVMMYIGAHGGINRKLTFSGYKFLSH